MPAAARSTRRTGVAFHSLRAVPLPVLTRAALALRDMAREMPLHIHVAEQVKEVESCRRAHRAPADRAAARHRPASTALVPGACHARHGGGDRGHRRGRRRVCVSISTEANLGDGFFDAARFLRAGGRLCIGSDSQATVCPAEELRWMEYQARLRSKRRGVLADSREPHVGTRLWRDAARHGAASLGQPAGVLAEGSRADWIVLDPDHPSMAGARETTALDHLLFSGGSAAIRDVMVAGRWVVRDGSHRAEQRLAGPFKALLQRLALDGEPAAPARRPPTSTR